MPWLMDGRSCDEYVQYPQWRGGLLCHRLFPIFCLTWSLDSHCGSSRRCKRPCSRPSFCSNVSLACSKDEMATKTISASAANHDVANEEEEDDIYEFDTDSNINFKIFSNIIFFKYCLFNQLHRVIGTVSCSPPGSGTALRIRLNTACGAR